MKQIPRRKVLQWGLGAGAVGALAACLPPTPPTHTDHYGQAAAAVDDDSTTTTTTDHEHDDDHARCRRRRCRTGRCRHRHGRRSRRQLARHPLRRRRVLLAPPVGVDPVEPGAAARTASSACTPTWPARTAVRSRWSRASVTRAPTSPHSEMLRRWWFGDTDGKQFPATASSGGSATSSRRPTTPPPACRSDGDRRRRWRRRTRSRCRWIPTATAASPATTTRA